MFSGGCHSLVCVTIECKQVYSVCINSHERTDDCLGPRSVVRRRLGLGGSGAGDRSSMGGGLVCVSDSL